MRTFAHVRADLAEIIGASAVNEVIATESTGWDLVLGPAVVGGTLDRHAAARGIPPSAAGLDVASQILSAVARVQAWSLTLTGHALEVTADRLGLVVSDGAVVKAVDLTNARVVTQNAAVWALDDVIEAVISACESVGARTPSRVVASAALFSWYAALRGLRSHLDGQAPADVLRRQWHSRWRLDSLVRTLAVPGRPDYLARAVCCLEYRCDAADARRYCTSCPMVAPNHVEHRLALGHRGGRRPFRAEHLRGAS